MKKLYILSLIAAALPSVASAVQPVSSKVNAAGLDIIERFDRGVLNIDDPYLLPPLSRGGAPVVKVTVKCDASVIDSLSAEGFSAEHIAKDFYIVTMPLDAISSFSESDEVESLSFGGMAEPVMNIARGVGAVNTCSTDIRLPHPFKGEGVIVGAFDTGFDPRHINFRNASDLSQTRLTYYANYNTSTGSPRVLRGQETLNGITDAADESHATHVVGIAAGAYNGSGFTFSGNNNGYGSNLSVGSDLGMIPYYGVAPLSEIAVCAGALSDANILSGVRAMIDFAKSEGKPIVINLSLGSTDGPHDGTETNVQALNALAEEAVICIASGNDGDANIYVGEEIMDAAGGSFNVMLESNFSRYIDCWSSTSSPFDVAVMVVNKETGAVAAEAVCANGRNLTINNSTPDIGECVTGSLSLTPRLDATNNRYEVRLYGSMALSSSYASTHAFALKISTSSPAKIDVYGNTYCSFAGFPLTGYVNPSGDGSISGMACGNNTICVGSFNTRQWWFTLNGASYSYNGSSASDGSISSFSSYGTLTDGRTLPDFCAPGSAIISSYSSNYVATQNVASALTGSATYGSDTYYWGVMQGTSMACPYASGTVALWLEANPELTGSQVKEIVKETANAPSSPSVAWGDGKLNAFKGLQRVLKKYPAGLSGVLADSEDDIMISSESGVCEVFAAGASSVAVQIYTVGGALAASVSTDGDTAQLSTDGLAKGVYVLRASADGSRTTTRKIVL